MAIVQEMNLNMIPDSAPVIIRVDQYDTGTGRLVAHLYEGPNLYKPGAGATASIQGTKPDKKGFAYTATIDGSTVTADLTQQMSCVGGNVRCQFVITEASGRTGTFVFVLKVQDSALADDTDISETELPDIIDAAEHNAERAEAAVEHYPYIDEETTHWMVWDVQAGEWVDTGITAKGEGLDPGTGITISAGVISVDADSTPTENSPKPVTSGGTYAALATKQDNLTFDNEPTDGSNNPVKSNGIYDALATKQDTLTPGLGINIDLSNNITVDADATPTDGSNKPVASNGVYDALATKQDNLTVGSNIQIDPLTNTISATDTTYSDATQSVSGLESAADKKKLDGIAAGAEVNVQSDWNVSDSTSDAFIKNKPTLGTAAAKNSTNAVTAGSIDLVESGAVKDAIDSAVTSAYKEAGTKTCAELTSALLIAANRGNVYNITDDGTTTADFVEGAGHPIKAGDNVGVTLSGSVYKFDLLSGFVDVSGFQTKALTTAVEGQNTVEGALGALSSDKQPKTMSAAVTVDGTSQTTVEGAIGAINTLAAANKTNKQDKNLSSAVESQTTVETALSALSSNKQPKTLSAAITVDGVSKTTVEDTLNALNTLAAGNKTALATKQDTLTEGTGIDITGSTISVDADAAPTQDSAKPATSGGTYTAIQAVQTALNTYIESLGLYVENGYICQRIN